MLSGNLEEDIMETELNTGQLARIRPINFEPLVLEEVYEVKTQRMCGPDLYGLLAILIGFNTHVFLGVQAYTVGNVLLPERFTLLKVRDDLAAIPVRGHECQYGPVVYFKYQNTVDQEWYEKQNGD